MTYQPPERFNIADYFLDARIREGKGDRPAIRTDEGVLSYRQVQYLANRFGNVLTDAGAEAEQRVLAAVSVERIGSKMGEQEAKATLPRKANDHSARAGLLRHCTSRWLPANPAFPHP